MSQRVTGSLLVAALFSIAAVIAGGCSDDDSDPSTASGGGQRRTTSTETDEAAAVSESAQLVGQSTGQVEVFDAPNDNEPTSHVFSASTEPSGLLTFLVLRQPNDEWLEVRLPSPPVGSTGFVRAEDVSLSRHRYRIEVSRASHTLKVYAGDVEAMTTPVAIGPDAPPVGTETYIKELLVPPDGTPYGGHVYGLAGWTSTEAQFGAGSGVVGIHPAAAAVLGTDAPTGSVGTDQQVLTRLVDNIGLPLGTPVVVTS